MNNQFTTGWQLSPYTNTTYTSFSYDTDAYGPIGSIDFHCPDKNIWVEELPIAQLANYNVRTIENIELELQNLTTQQKWAFFENFKRYFIIEIQPNGQTFYLISVYISGQKSLGTWQIRK